MNNDLRDILGPAYATYPGSHVKVGVICIAAIPYVMNRYYTITPVDSDPQSPDHQRYRLSEKHPAALASGNQERWQLPHRDLNLDNDEDLVVVKVKRRPVVVLSYAIGDERKAVPSRFHDSFWCVPSYTLEDPHGHPQWDVSFIEDVQHLTYRCCFPLPYDPTLHDRTSMLRLDRTQPIPRNHLKPTERRFAKEWTL